MIALSLLRVIEIVIVAGGWTCVGHALLPRGIREDENRPVVWATSLAVGCGVVAVALTILAMCHLHARVYSVAVAVLSSAFALGRMIHAGVRRNRTSPAAGKNDRWELAWLVALSALVIIALFATLAPPSSMDATVYHLRAPREIVRHGFWTPMDEPHGYQPLYVEMLFGEALAIGPAALAALVHWVLGLGAITVAAAWAGLLGGRPIWGAVIFGCTGLFVWEATSSFIDLGLALFCGLALFWAMRGDVRGSTVLAGLFGGLAAGTKFTGGVAALLVGITAAFVVWPDRAAAFRRLVTVAVLSLLVAGPWYLRDFVLTGNPIYPLANRLWGLPPVTLALLPYGYGRDLFHLLTSPFDVVVRGDVFDQGWSVGPAYLAFVPIAIAVRPTRRVLIATGAIVCWWVIWFFSSPQTRLLLPVLPVAAGIGSVAVTAAFRSSSRAVRGAATAVLAVAAVGAFGTAAVSARTTAGVVLGRESPQDYLRRTSWSYAAYDEANRRLPPDARVWVTGAGNLYYLEREARLGGPENRPAGELAAEGFTHELWIGPCPTPNDPDRRLLASGEFPLRASRIVGGVWTTRCYRLAVLAPAPSQ